MMDTRVIDLSKDKNFVRYPYLQSKKTHMAIDNYNWNQTINNSHSIKDTKNPFSVF